MFFTQERNKRALEVLMQKDMALKDLQSSFATAQQQLKDTKEQLATTDQKLQEADVRLVAALQGNDTLRQQLQQQRQQHESELVRLLPVCFKCLCRGALLFSNTLFASICREVHSLLLTAKR